MSVQPSTSTNLSRERRASGNDGDDSLLRLYMAYRRKLLVRAARLTGDGSVAEDLLQDAWMRFDAAASIKPQRANAAYLRMIVDNLVRDWRRRGRARWSIFHEAENVQAVATHVSTPAPTPEAQVIARDQLRVLARALAGMPPRTRTAIVMHRLEGSTLRQIAARLGVSVTTAHTLIADALARCRAAVFDGQ